MSLIGYNLNKYPLENHYRISRQYIHQSVDWAEILNVIGKRGATSIDVSNTISLFPHLPDTVYVPKGDQGMFVFGRSECAEFPPYP